MAERPIAESGTCPKRMSYEAYDKWPDVCSCSHPVRPYNSRTGPRCTCCFGARQIDGSGRCSAHGSLWCPECEGATDE